MSALDTSSDVPRPARLGSMAWLSRYGTLAAFVLLIAVNAAITPNFLSLQTLSLNLTQVAPIVIVATGMTLVIATGGIDQGRAHQAKAELMWPLDHVDQQQIAKPGPQIAIREIRP